MALGKPMNAPTPSIVIVAALASNDHVAEADPSCGATGARLPSASPSCHASTHVSEPKIL